MRNRISLALLLSATLAMPVAAQRMAPSGVVRPPVSSAPQPPTRFIQRMHRYGNWGAAGGAMAGFAIGMLTTPSDDTRSARLVGHTLIGAAVGNLGGLIVGMNERQASDTLPAELSNDVLRSPMPVLAARLENASGYVGMGGRIGASLGTIGGVLLGNSEGERALYMLMGGLEGWTGGMLVGGITYLVRRSQH
jgi:hypothetical protein